MKRTVAGMLLAATLLVACSGPKSPGGPPVSKPGSFELSGSIDCAAGVVTVSLRWTAASGASTYVVRQDGEELSNPLTVRELEVSGGFTAGSEVTFVVRASNAIGTTDSNAWSVTVPACRDGEPDPNLKVRSLAHSGGHLLAAMSDGRVLSWGINVGGALGRDGSVEIGLPEFIAGLEHIESVAAGSSWSLALDEDGVVWSWGSNGSGQLRPIGSDCSAQPETTSPLTLRPRSTTMSSLR